MLCFCTLLVYYLLLASFPLLKLWGKQEEDILSVIVVHSFLEEYAYSHLFLDVKE